MGESNDTRPVGGDGGKILVTGSNGQLGKELQQIASSFPYFDFIFLSRADLPIHDFEKVKNIFKTHHPLYVINCAAYTAVDEAETEKELASKINGEAVGVLASLCKEQYCKFIHISTDYVFDGTATVPYKEDSPTNPQSIYGASKLEGEKQALQCNPDSLIIRTSWMYSEFEKNFVKTMLKLLSEKKEINIVNDQIGSPTYAKDLAEAILQIIVSENLPADRHGWQPGIYNYSNEGIISWYDFAVAIKEMIGSQCRINPIPTSQYPTPAKRPAYSVLDKSKIQKAFGIELKDWKESLATCLDSLK
ncbi:MAG: dTDP-4-dehydrorhamnose reductase [Chitinophagaceae bacterium]|nr:dTDP-4-dehydrorhamnose reductase [Chitinophagaceae bacterium]